MSRKGAGDVVEVLDHAERKDEIERAEGRLVGEQVRLDDRPLDSRRGQVLARQPDAFGTQLDARDACTETLGVPQKPACRRAPQLEDPRLRANGSRLLEGTCEASLEWKVRVGPSRDLDAAVIVFLPELPAREVRRLLHGARRYSPVDRTPL